MDNQTYEYGEVITHDDLHSIYQGFLWQLKQLKWYQFNHRLKLQMAAIVMDNLHIWLHQGKPAVQTVSIPRNGGFHDEN